MSRMLIKGARVIDPAGGLDEVCDLHLADGRILAAGQAPDGFEPDRTLDAAGLVAAPGLIDLGARLQESAGESRATVASETRAAAAGGITTVCAVPDARHRIDSPSEVELMARYAREAGQSRVAVLGALTKDLEGQHLTEMAALKDAGCVAVSDGGRPVTNSLVLRRALEYAATFDLTVFLTPADPYLSEGGYMHEGWVSGRLGIPSIPAAAETAALGRDLALVEETGARVHFTPLSTAAGAALVADAAAKGLPVSADVAAHQLFLTEMDVTGFNSLCYVRPPLRGQDDRDALRRAVAEGTITAICSDHQPHQPDAKEVPFTEALPGISALDSFLALTLRLVEEGLMDLPTALARVTSGPAAVAGLERGRLAPGAAADLVLFDPKERWFFNTANMVSRGRNSPFGGWEFEGRVRHTLVGGELVYTAASQ